MQMFPWMIMMITIMMVMSSNSWLNIWILMEMNSISFIFMMCQDKILMKKESPIKYFLIQSIGSSILLNMFLIKSNWNASYSLIQLSLMIIIISMVMALKMGMAPIHMWLLSVAKSISWTILLILLTIQKVIPIYLMMKFSKMVMILFLSMLSILMGTLSQMNNKLMKMILTFSSINHLGWMMMTSKINIKMTWMYLLLYSMMSVVMVVSLKMLNVKSLSNQMSKNYKYSIMLTLMSLAGIPPLMGFFPKWSILNEMMMNNMSMYIIMSMLMMSSINFYIYMKISTNSMLMKKNKMNKKNSMMKMNITNMMLPNLMIHLKK